MTSPRRTAAGLVLALVALAGPAAGCGDDDQGGDPDIVVSEVVVALPAGANTAIYLTVENSGTGTDHLVDVRTDAGDRAELHETREGDDGLLRMHHVERVEVRPGETVRFETGGLHVMVFGARRLADGDRVTVELVFERSGVVEVDGVVRSHAEILG